MGKPNVAELAIFSDDSYNTAFHDILAWVLIWNNSLCAQLGPPLRVGYTTSATQKSTSCSHLVFDSATTGVTRSRSTAAADVDTVGSGHAFLERAGRQQWWPWA
jgi:hypothetical protein